MNDADEFLKWLYGPEGGGSHIRPQHVLRFVTDIPNEAGETFWQVITETWPDFDLIPHPAFEEQFRRFRLTAPGSCAKQPCLLYRGQDVSAPLGLSWTRDRAVAEGFAKGHRGILNANPVVFSYQPSPSEIAFVCDERDESEVVLLEIPSPNQVRRAGAR
jgi:hypothetical protein